MSNIRKAYLEKWNFEYASDKWTLWFARNEIGECIVSTSNKKDCEQYCIKNGYIPVMK